MIDVADADIAAAIDRHDDPSHPDAYTVSEVREVLGRINADIIDHWDPHQDALDAGAYEIVHEDDEAIVLADGGGFWSEQFNAMGIDDENGICYNIVVSLHHTAARTHCDYSWSGSTPVVVKKPDDFGAGEQHVLREVARRTKEYGSVSRAVDSLATDVHGWNEADWARLTEPPADSTDERGPEQ